MSPMIVNAGDAAEKFFLGTSWINASERYVALGALAVFGLHARVITRVGSYKGIYVTSRSRLAVCFAGCLLVCLGGYQLTLLLRPTDSWLRLVLYFVLAPITVFLVAGIAAGFGTLVDHGRAIVVITSRYQPPRQRPTLLNVMEEGGKKANFIGVAAHNSYVIFQSLGLLVALIAYFAR